MQIEYERTFQTSSWYLIASCCIALEARSCDPAHLCAYCFVLSLFVCVFGSKSHTIGSDADFRRVIFDMKGRSPLVEHFLVCHRNLAKRTNTIIRAEMEPDRSAEDLHLFVFMSLLSTLAFMPMPVVMVYP